MSARPVVVDQCSKPLHPTVWLEVSYWGTEPPTALFEDLEVIGWRPPVPAAPPASAIDWDAADAATGERFTIRPWRVEGAVVEPPRGSGPRGHWTEADRAAFLVPLQGVLRRHGLADAHGGDAGASRSGAHPRPPAEDHPGAGAAPPPSPVGSAVVRAELAPGVDRDAVAAALAPLGVAAHVAAEPRSITTTYRGTAYETQVTVVHAEVLVDAERAPVVAAVLADLGLRPTVDGAGPDPTTAAAIDVRHGAGPPQVPHGDGARSR